MKKFCFTVDDNIRFLQELTEGEYESLFSHPYTKLLKRLRETYDVKIQLNLFYENDSFTLAQTTDRYRAEWQANAEWLKLSFHSRLENVRPYEYSGYDEVYRDCSAVHDEIVRFAGEKSLAKTTTVHYCRTTKEGTRALQDCGVQGLLGLYGEKDTPRTSYSCTEALAKKARVGEIIRDGNMAFAGIDVILNQFEPQENLEKLERIKDRRYVKIMIHEQYFYPDYPRYQPHFAKKLEQAFSFLQANGFTSCFFEDMIESEV